MADIPLNDLTDTVDNYFLFKRIDVNDPLIDEVFRLRYQVYCLERNFESISEHPSGLERDAYDKSSSHFCAISKLSGRIVGSVRIIHPSEFGFPIELHCDLGLHHNSDNITCSGEISRLAISKEFFRHEIAAARLAASPRSKYKTLSYRDLHRLMRLWVVSGLYKCVYQHSMEAGLTHWYAVMVEGLFNLLNRWHISWTPIGDEVEYHGRRIPYMAEINLNEKNMRKHNSSLLEPPCGWKAMPQEKITLNLAC